MYYNIEWFISLGFYLCLAFICACGVNKLYRSCKFDTIRGINYMRVSFKNLNGRVINERAGINGFPFMELLKWKNGQYFPFIIDVVWWGEMRSYKYLFKWMFLWYTQKTLWIWILKIEFYCFNELYRLYTEKKGVEPYRVRKFNKNNSFQF